MHTVVCVILNSFCIVCENFFIQQPCSTIVWLTDGFLPGNFASSATEDSSGLISGFRFLQIGTAGSVLVASM